MTRWSQPHGVCCAGFREARTGCFTAGFAVKINLTSGAFISIVPMVMMAVPLTFLLTTLRSSFAQRSLTIVILLLLILNLLVQAYAARSMPDHQSCAWHFPRTS